MKTLISVIIFLGIQFSFADGVIQTVNGTTTIGGTPITGNAVTNSNSFSVVVSNTWKFDAAHALSLSNLTASRFVFSGADNGLSSATASGAVPINADGTASTFVQVNALAPSSILTNNNSFAVVISNTIKMDAAHALSLSNLTASRIVLSGADNGLSSAAASGAVPVDADGSASTFTQINALAPASVITNNNSFAVVVSNAWKMDAAHSLSLSNLTASRIVLSGADKGLASAAASGAVPVDADGSATTFDQVNALAPGTVQTNGQTTGYTNTGNIKSATANATTITASSINASNIIASTNGYVWSMSATPVALTNIVYTNVTLDFGSTATLTFSDLPVVIANLKSNDMAQINPPAISQTNGVFTAWISNTTLFARYHNYQASAVNPASGIFNIQVFQYK